MRVAIVNDLALATEVLRRLVRSAPGHSVAWMAADGAEAVKLAAADPPDVILMDLIMPVMDGVEATRRIMADSPCPILLVTSSVSTNFAKVYEAMGHGALDAVDTPTLGSGGVQNGEPLLARLAKLEAVRSGRSSGLFPVVPVEDHGGKPRGSPSKLPPLLALGASTGGPEALAQVLTALPVGGPAVLIVQHIAAAFAPSLATWLSGRTGRPVRIAQAGDEPQSGLVLLAGSDDHLTLTSERRLAYVAEPHNYPYRPSVDVFFASLAASWPQPGAAAVLTGMGSDGGRGLLRLRQAGWLTLAQDQATSVVYGMPKAAADLGAAERILPLPLLATAAGNWAARSLA